MSETEPTTNAYADQPDWEALARHLAEESTAEEWAAVAAWLAAHPDDARAFQVLAAAGDGLRRARPSVDVEAALARVQRRLPEPQRPVVPLSPRIAPRPLLAWTLAAAAVVVIAVGVARLRNDPVTPVVQTLATAVGQVDSVRLADGTRVVLGPASEMEFDAVQAGGRREVRLRGSAFFDVTHDAARPFTVRAGDARITDVGTAFTVRADEADGVEVSVSEGAVRVRREGSDGAELRAGDFATLPPTGALVVQRAGASASDSAWTSGRLVFRESPIGRVRSDLRRWYGVELVVADSSLASRHLTAAFDRESRRQVIDVIALALGATYSVHGDTVTLRPASLSIRPRK